MPRNSPTDTDQELESLRERRRQELLHRPAAASRKATEDPSPTVATTASFDRLVSENARVVVDVWAAWCGPCRYLSPIVDELAKEMQGSVKFAKVNADEEPEIPGRFGVEGIPTLLFFNHGKLLGRVVGALPKEVLRSRIQEMFGGAQPGSEGGFTS